MKKVTAKQESTTVSTTVKDSMASKKEGYEAAGIPVDRLVVCNGLPLSTVEWLSVLIRKRSISIMLFFL